jgi:drug/metabolite transporter (DMT)-like permease
LRVGTLVIPALIYFAITLGALALLRRQRTTGRRTGIFLGFVVVCIVLTRWTTRTWHLFMGEAAAAWIAALLVVGATVLLIQKREGRER